MTRNYQICVLITELGIGGAQKVLADVVTALPRDKYQVQVACLFNPGATAARLQDAGIEVVDLQMHSRLDWLVLWRLWRLLRQSSPDILHTHMFHANLVGRLSGTLANVPYIISTEHTMGQEGRIRRLLNKITSALCDRVIAVSQSVGTYAMEVIGIEASKVIVIANGIDVNRYTSRLSPREARGRVGLPAGAAVIGTVGTLRKVKGTSILLRAFAGLHPRWPDTRLIIVGDGPERNNLQSLAQSLRIERSTIFTGERADVTDFLAAMTVFVLPSYWEGFGLAAVEAMAAGLPVVATRVGSLPEVILEGETGLLVPPSDPAVMAAAIEHLLANPDLGSQMGQAGRQRALVNYTRERMVTQTEELYKTLLTPSR